VHALGAAERATWALHLRSGKMYFYMGANPLEMGTCGVLKIPLGSGGGAGLLSRVTGVPVG